MNRYSYAQINALGVCVAVTDSHRPIESPSMIAIESADPDYIGRTYAGGNWQD